MKVRRAALNRIGQNTIRAGVPTVMIEEPLVPIYMYHRYAVEGAASMIGGQDFTYAMRGDGHGAPMTWVAGEAQRKAIDSLAATLKPSELTIPKTILDLIPPRPPGYRHAPGAVPADDRRRLRPGQSRRHRRGRRDRLRAAARSRRPHGRAVRRRPVAARTW